MADVDEVAHLFLARTGRRLRVATKYLTQTRAFFARHGIVDYRIVESGGATEGAPAAGAAELIVDITTTGATLAANGLKVLADGLILSSQAQLAASLARRLGRTARLAAARRLARILEARARARRTATLTWPAEADAGGPSGAEGVARRAAPSRGRSACWSRGRRVRGGRGALADERRRAGLGRAPDVRVRGGRASRSRRWRRGSHLI